jgi:hypothetical protein
LSRVLSASWKARSSSCAVCGAVAAWRNACGAHDHGCGVCVRAYAAADARRQRFPACGSGRVSGNWVAASPGSRHRHVPAPADPGPGSEFSPAPHLCWRPEPEREAWPTQRANDSRGRLRPACRHGGRAAGIPAAPDGCSRELERAALALTQMRVELGGRLPACPGAASGSSRLAYN